MDLDKAIQSRQSIRSFKDKKPDWRDIIEAIDATRYAPMAGNIFTLKFILVSDREKIEKLADASQQDFIAEADYVVVVCSENGKTENAFKERSQKYARLQAGAAIENFLLKIEDLGLATCWIGHFVDSMIKRILNIPENVEVEALFPIGYAKQGKGQKKRRQDVNIDGILFFDEYKNKKMNPPKRVEA